MCSWLPGVIFPGASIIQLVTLIRSKNSVGVIVLTWFLFTLANIAAYIYIQKYTEPQTIGFLLVAIAQFAIVYVALLKRRVPST